MDQKDIGLISKINKINQPNQNQRSNATKSKSVLNKILSTLTKQKYISFKKRGKKKGSESSALLGHTNSFTPTTSGLGMLATYTKTPVVSQTSMVPDFLKSLQVIPQLHIQCI